jgi:NADPH-dependent curcumin reductase CurA
VGLLVDGVLFDQWNDTESTGLENAPETLRRLFEGRNEGKQLLRVAE